MRAAPAHRCHPSRLLVVDDEATITELLSGSLRLAGFEVVTAASGAEALRAATSARPDLVLLDVMMPDGDGFEAASAPGSTGQLTVADRGPGMTAQQAARVFERFYRTDGARSRSRGGAGLGLAIAAVLAAAHGGEITVETAPGRGASFCLRLPLAAADGTLASEAGPGPPLARPVTR